MFDSICSQKPNRAEYKVNKTTKTSSSPIIWTLHGQYFHDTKKNLAERNRNSNNGVDLRQMTLNINAYLKQRAKSVARMAFSSICMTSSYSSCLMLLRISFPCQKEIIRIDLKRKNYTDQNYHRKQPKQMLTMPGELKCSKFLHQFIWLECSSQ